MPPIMISQTGYHWSLVLTCQVALPDPEIAVGDENVCVLLRPFDRAGC